MSTSPRRSAGDPQRSTLGAARLMLELGPPAECAPSSSLRRKRHRPGHRRPLHARAGLHGVEHAGRRRCSSTTSTSASGRPALALRSARPITQPPQPQPGPGPRSTSAQTRPQRRRPGSQRDRLSLDIAQDYERAGMTSPGHRRLPARMLVDADGKAFALAHIAEIKRTRAIRLRGG